MDRRVSIKYALSLGLISVFSVSAYKYFTLNRNLNIVSLIDNKLLISELAETIIPETDTPGAKRAGVENYIINVMTNCKTKLEQNKFLNGLQDVEAYSFKNFGKSFSKCNMLERNKVLIYFSTKDDYSVEVINKINKKIFGATFFLQLKQLTVEGYCQSELGATQGLSYDPIPVYYEACVPIQLNQKSWATK